MRRPTELSARLVVGLLCTGAAPLVSQSSAAAHVSLRLLTLSLVADSSYGLQLLVEPRSGTTGNEHGLVWLRLDPDSALDWLNSAAAVLRTPVSGGPPDAIQWSATLRPVDGRGGFLLGRHRKKGRLEKDHWLAIADSTPGWQVEIAPTEADSLLHLFLVLAPAARIDTSSQTAADQGHVDRPAALTHQPELSGRLGSGHVAAQYVVGIDGRADPVSLLVLLAGSPRLEVEAREIILGSRFEAAQKAGRPVRQLVQQVLTFK